MLSSTIPSELGALTLLTDLRLNGNEDMSGTIPSELSQLTNLIRLDLRSMSLSGSLHSSVGNM